MQIQHFSNTDIMAMEKVFRLNLINSVSGYKPANLIGTKSKDGLPNLAIFSSVIHLGSNPPLLGCITRPTHVQRHTYENIKTTGVFTINHVKRDFIEKAHYTSAKFEKEVSEFKRCQLEEEYLADFEAPFVKESDLKMGLRLVEEIPIKSNDTILLVGKIEHLFLPKSSILEDGRVDLVSLEEVCISGLNNYHHVGRLASFPYARREEVPIF